ncbi:VTC domain-containing protein [Fennellomyces sp. T-0311]|nr:VTC domain-containing protein [Fennellomyces sp. T-0311]
MKFGSYLKANLFAPWQNEYIQYDMLKLGLKSRQLDHAWNDKDELWFTETIASELAKVDAFISRKRHELESRIQYCEQTNNAMNHALIEILYDTNDLSKFARLNHTGFQKIVKKHDKWTHITSSPIDGLDNNQRFDDLLIRISQLRDRTTSAPAFVETNEAVGDFERATEKYWVHPDNITEVKAILLYYLPVLRYNADRPYDEAETAISSVYLDNRQFELYTERLQRDEGAEAIRLRWYGAEDNQDIYVERKTHHAPWLPDQRSIKDRFRLDECHVDAFLAGRHTPEMIAQHLKKKAADKALFTAKGIQQSILEKNLRPTLRCFYHRLAFQKPGDARLRVSLDTDLAFIRENSQKWRRDDVGIKHPFHHLAQQDVECFPYAILETKIQTHLGQQVPEWLTRLTTSHLVHPVPRFSKYLHGASRFFHKELAILPWWLSELRIDIRKPRDLIGLSRTVSLRPLLDGGLVAVDIPSTKQDSAMLEVKPLPPSRQSSTIHSKRKKRFSFRTWIRRNGNKKPLLPSVKVRVEPKTFFANERTFISWLQFCALILTISLSLINFGDHVSQMCGGFFLIISALLAIYALWRYQYRSWQIRTRSNSRYDDMYGPAILCTLLVIAIIVNFSLRFNQPSSPGSTPYHPAENR